MISTNKILPPQRPSATFDALFFLGIHLKLQRFRRLAGAIQGWLQQHDGGTNSKQKTGNPKTSFFEEIVHEEVHPGKLTCHLKRNYFNRKYIFQPSFFRGYVSFQGGKQLVNYTLPKSNSSHLKNGWLEHDPFLKGFGPFSGANG